MAWKARHQNNRVDKYASLRRDTVALVTVEVETELVGDTTLQTHIWRNNELAQTLAQAECLEVILWYTVSTWATLVNWTWPNDCHANIIPAQWHLCLISDDDLILHRHWDVIDKKLQ
jgi:hypothetical protein